MKLLLLAAVAATFTLSVAPAMASPELAIGRLPTTGLETLERRSGRCPGGESRAWKAGCGGA